MSFSGVVDKAVDSKVDVRFVAQANSLGILADDVVGALIRAEAGLAPLAGDRAVAEAANIFSRAAAEDNAPVGIWQKHEVSSALRRMTAAQSIADEASPAPQSTSRLQVIADALESALNGKAQEGDIRLLRVYFEAVANTTLEAAAATVRSRGTATAWLTI